VCLAYSARLAVFGASGMFGVWWDLGMCWPKVGVLAHNGRLACVWHVQCGGSRARIMCMADVSGVGCVAGVACWVFGVFGASSVVVGRRGLVSKISQTKHT
jgi:hypothetical protein